jgi:hypothetical protein
MGDYAVISWPGKHVGPGREHTGGTGRKRQMNIQPTREISIAFTYKNLSFPVL